MQSLKADCISGFGFKMGEGGRVRGERDLEKRGGREGGGRRGGERERRKGGGGRRGGEREKELKLLLICLERHSLDRLV